MNKNHGKNGRFIKGNKAQKGRTASQLLDDYQAKLMQKGIDNALTGDKQTLNTLLNKILNDKLPTLKTGLTSQELIDFTVSEGLNPQQISAMTKLISTNLAANEAKALEEELKKIQKSLKRGGGGFK